MTALVVLALRMLAIAALYAFLGLALWMMWQELRQSAADAAEPKIPPIRLQFRTRGQRPGVRLFSQPEIILGRDRLSDLPLSDGAVSARHARLSYHDGQWWAEDLESSNGTRLNRGRLLGPTVITDGDEIKCGVTKVLVTMSWKSQRPRSNRGGEDD